MRFEIELVADGDDRVSGFVIRPGEPSPVPFAGWLELLGVLEAVPHMNEPIGRQT